MKKLSVFLLFIFAFFSFSCEIGLGASVDTEAPVFEITNPPSDAVIRDEFTICGNWTDDGTISSVTVEMNRLDNGTKTKFEGLVTTNGERGSGKWNITINPSENGLLDGTYEALVAVNDNGGHTTTMARTFTIDNTAPVMILQKPSTTLSDAADRFDSFGQILSIVGQAADDNSIEKIDVSIYSSPDCSDSSFIKTITLSNVPPTIDLNVATFEENQFNEYAEIYGQASKGAGNVRRYFKLAIYDNAKKYNADGSVDEVGNKQSSYYLYKDISDIITEFKATGLYKIKSGTFSGSGRAVSVDSAKDALANKSNEIGKFQMNPDNSPTFVVSSRSPLASGADLDDIMYQLTSGNNQLEVQVDPGLDNNPIVEDSVGLYLIECDKFGVIKPSVAPIWLFHPKTEEDPDAHAESKVSIVVSGDSFKFKTADMISSLRYEELEIEHYYRICVVGCDNTGCTIVPQASGIYAFKLASSGNFIELDISADKSFITSNNNNGNENNSVTVHLRCQGGNTPYVIWEDGVATSYNIVDGNTGIDIPLDITNITKWPAGKSSIKYQVKGGAGSASTEKEILFTRDDVLPVINETTVHIGSDNENTNNSRDYYYKNINLNVKGEFSEQNMDTIYYYVQWPGREGNVPANLSVTQDGEISKFTNGIFEFKGVEFHENSPAAIPSKNILYIQAKDKSGNLSERKQIYVNVDTSAPHIGNVFYYRLGTDTDPALPATGQIYVDGTKDLIIYGKGYDLESGFDSTTPLTFKIGDSTSAVNAAVTYATTEPAAGSDMTSLTYGAIPSDTSSIKYWKAVISKDNIDTADKCGTLYVKAKNGAGVESSNISIFNITHDNTPPLLSNVSFVSSNTRKQPYKKSSTEYFVNNTDGSPTFTISGIATDNCGVRDVSLTINGIAKPRTSTGLSEWAFSNIDLSSFTEDSTVNAIIIATDLTGQTSSHSFTIKFDTTPPKAMHWADANNKDIYFRIGNSNNEKTNNLTWETGDPAGDGTTPADLLNTDVGNKYAYGSWGNDSTIEVRGTFDEAATGSGMKRIHYAIFNVAPADAQITALENGTLSVTEGSSVKTIGSFDPLSTPDTKKVSYSKDATSKSSKEVITNFRTTLSGFNEINNYLVLVAEDNAGNRAADTLVITEGTAADGTNNETAISNGTSNWNSENHTTPTKYYNINKDTHAPNITSNVVNGVYTNGTGVGSVTISGTASDTESGIKNVVITMEDTVIATIKPEDFTGENNNVWTATISDSSFAGAANGSSYTIYAKATDNAGVGNSKQISAGTITVDKENPDISNLNLNVTTGSGSSAVTKAVYSKLDEDNSTINYYLNNSDSGKIFKITGLATDNYGIANVSLDVETNPATDPATKLQTQTINNPTGTWEFTIGTETDNWTSWNVDGASAKIKVTDKAGNTKEKTLNIVFDRTAPVVNLENDSNEALLITPTTTQTEASLFKFEGKAGCVSGTGTDTVFSGFDKVDIAFTNAPASGDPEEPSAAQTTANVASDGSWSSTVDFTNSAFGTIFRNDDQDNQGTKNLWVRAYDNAGNAGEWVHKEFVYDKTTPTISFTDTVDDTTTNITTNPIADSKRNHGFKLEVNVFDSYGVDKVEVKYGTETIQASKTNETTNHVETWSKAFRTSSGTGTEEIVSDGLYSFEVIVTDKSGKTNKVTRSLTIDTESPQITAKNVADTISPAYTDSSSDPDISWYKTNQIPVTVTVNDTLSGVTNVQVSTDGTNFSNPASLMLSGDSWTGNIVCSEQGPNTIYIKATDAAGNSTEVSSDNSLTARIDTQAPDTPVLLGVDSDAGTVPASEITSVLVNKQNSLTVYFALVDSQTSDKSTGIATSNAIKQKGKNGTSAVVEYSALPALIENDILAWETSHAYTAGTAIKHDSKVYICQTDHTSESPFATTNWKEATLWSYIIPISDMTSGGISFTVKDNAENSADYNLFQMSVDNTPPNLQFTSPEENAEVNKIITVTGKATDANDVSEITLTATCGSGATAVTKTYTKTSTDAATKINYENGNWTATIDTRELDSSFSTTPTDVTLKLTARDAAGNETPAADAVSLTIKVNQNSDRPVVTIGSGVDFTQKNGNEIWVKNSSTIYGSVIDDDGIATNGFKIYRKLASADDSTYIDANASYTGGSWNVRLPSDDSYVLKFEVKDKGIDASGAATGNTFVSANITSASTDAQILATPLIQDSPDSGAPHQLGESTTNGNTFVPICLDTKPPVLTITGISLDNTTWSEDVNTSDINLGGDNSSFYVKAEASDSSGLFGDTDVSGITASFSGSMNNGAYTVSSTSSDYTVTKTDATDKNEFIIHISNFATAKNASDETRPFSGTLTITITAKDKAGQETPKNFSRTVDNSAPVIKINAPEATITSTAVVTGSIEGETTNPTIYYTVKDTNTQPAVNDVSWTEESHAALTYNVYFDGSTSTTTTHERLFKNYLWDLDLTSEAEVIAGTYSEFTTLYVWIKAVDNCGNISYKSAPVVVDPQGNRPTVTITYPDNNTTLGGTIRVMGTANDNIEAKFAWLQIDINENGEGDWDLEDYNILSAVTKSDDSPYYTFGKISTNQTLADAGITTVDSTTNISDIGIMVPVSGGSWYQNLNTTNELIPTGTSNKITINVYATDNDNGSTILQSNAASRTITVDKDAPYFVQSSLKLVRYNTSGSVTAEQAYKEGMSVKGEWWLEGQIKDDSSGISTITVTEGTEGTGTQLASIDSTRTQLTSGDYQFTRVSGTGPTGETIYNYNLKIKVSAETGVGGKEFYIRAEENKTSGPLSTGKSFIVRYDNQPPTLAANNVAEFNINTSVKNSLGYYHLGSAAFEKNSGDTGVERVAVFFTRTLDGVTYVYDPMYKRSASASCLETGTAIIKDSTDNMYWGSASATSITSDTLTLSAAPASYVHAGGLAKIKGVVYRINSISGNSVILSGEPGDSTSATDVYFAVANVVDNTSQESKGTANSAYNSETGFGYGYCNNYTYDDGDKIMENFHKDTSTNWTWELWVNSKNIPDGDLAIHYVAFDKAGNTAYDCVDNAVVENNKPRLVSVKVGLDVNQDGEISEAAAAGEVSYYYPAGMAAKPTEYSEGVEAINISNITVKGLMKVVPEVVGGNGDLFYRWKTKTTDWQSVTTKLMDGNNNYDDGNFSDTDDYKSEGHLTTQTGTITHDIDWLITNSTANCDDFFINYEIADSTQGRTQFAEGASASNKLSINITNINLLVRDEEAPVVTINPFYWNSRTDNSVYNQEGHIELPSDLPSANFTATSGEFDNDPKLSGKVKLTGSLSDNKLLTEVYVTLPGMTGLSTATKVATYNKAEGKWKNADGTADFATIGSLATEGYEFTILQSTNSFDVDDGHTVDWSLIWDTSKITNVAQTDVNLQIQAKDDAIHAGHTENRSHTASYKVDVVPYITGIDTQFSKNLKSSIRSAYSRTALGHYIARSNETIIIKGYNLTNSTIVPKYGSTNLEIDNDGNVKLPVNLMAASGQVSLTVNDISTLNNKNNNDACGSYKTGTTNITESSLYAEKNAYAYNRMPNKSSNNLLTDDIVVDIWQIESDAAKPMSGELREPSMKINPVTGQVGLAFVSGPADIAMADTINGLSYSRWQNNYATFKNISFTYDALGNAHATATGLDTNPKDKHAGRFSYFYSKWGQSGLDSTGNYVGTNALRLESISVPYIKGTTTKTTLTNNTIYEMYLNNEKPCEEETNYKVLANKNLIDSTSNGVLTETRFNSPSLAATVHGTGDAATTSVYLAYYDSIQKQIRFRYNSGVAAEWNADGSSNGNDFADNTGYFWNKTGIQSISETNGGYQDYMEASTDNFSLIAGVDTQQGETVRNDISSRNQLVKTFVDKESYRRAKNIKADGTVELDSNNNNGSRQYTITDSFEITNARLNKIDESLRSRFHEGDLVKALIWTNAYYWIIQNDGLIYISDNDNNVPCGQLTHRVSSIKASDYNYKGYTIDPDFDNNSEYRVYERIDSSWSGQSPYFLPIGSASSTVTRTIEVPVYKQWTYNAYDTGYTGYKYVAIDAIAGSAASNDIVVAVWYDGSGLRYAYNDNPTSGLDNGSAGGWKGNKVIFSEGGEYCAVKVDKNGGVHIAAYADGCLRYAYLSSYSASYNESTDSVIVDSFTITGERIGLDVGLQKVGNTSTYVAVPYITYYNGTARKPSIAKLVIPENGVMNYKANGTGTDDGDDIFTGNWEISIIPSECNLTTQQYDRMNIALWKNSDGKIVRGDDSSTFGTGAQKTTEDNTSTTENGEIYGNGTANPIFGYAVESTTGVNLETAQMK